MGGLFRSIEQNTMKKLNPINNPQSQAEPVALHTKAAIASNKNTKSLYKATAKPNRPKLTRQKFAASALSTGSKVAVEVVNTTVTVTLPYPGRSPKLLVLLNDHKFDSSTIEADSTNTIVTVSRKFTSSGFA